MNVQKMHQKRTGFNSLYIYIYIYLKKKKKTTGQVSNPPPVPFYQLRTDET